MPYLVNGQIVPEQVIREESERISRDPFWGTISDEGERARRLRLAAEASAADRLLIEQLSTSDPRPIDLSALEQETEVYNYLSVRKSLILICLHELPKGYRS
jgi:hypothetical protein